MVAVEFPISEAEALLKRLAPDGIKASMTAAECDAVEAARKRIQQAVKVERGSCGSDPLEMEALASGLVGKRVRVQTSYGSVKTGKLLRLSGFRTLVIEDGPLRHPVSLGVVTSLERERVIA